MATILTNNSTQIDVAVSLEYSEPQVMVTMQRQGTTKGAIRAFLSPMQAQALAQALMQELAYQLAGSSKILEEPSDAVRSS